MISEKVQPKEVRIPREYVVNKRVYVHDSHFHEFTHIFIANKPVCKLLGDFLQGFFQKNTHICYV